MHRYLVFTKVVTETAKGICLAIKLTNGGTESVWFPSSKVRLMWSKMTAEVPKKMADDKERDHAVKFATK